MEGCAIISKINSKEPERVAGDDLVKLVGTRRRCEQLENRFEQLSWLGWVVGGALLFRASHVTYFGAALASVAGGVKCSEWARSYGQLVETYREVEVWSAEPKQEVGPKIDTQELNSEVEKMVNALKKIKYEEDGEVDLGLLVKYVLLVRSVSELELRIAEATRQIEAEPKVPARLACWKAHAELGAIRWW